MQYVVEYVGPDGHGYEKVFKRYDDAKAFADFWRPLQVPSPLRSESHA